MKNYFLVGVFYTVCGFSLELNSATLNANQVLQRVLDNYPSVYSAQFQVEKARQNITKVNSRLGWQLIAGGGVAKDVSLFGSKVNIVDINAGMQRLLDSGDSVSITGSLRRDNADVTTIPGLPNPSISTNITMNYRKPLRKSAGNLQYLLDKQRAQLSVDISQTILKGLYDQLAESVADLYFAALSTRERIENIQQSLQRTRRLQNFIKSRFSLGIAENKDQLQVAAQFHAQSAQLKALDLAWVQQTVALNRLMGEAWNKEIDLLRGKLDVDVALYSKEKIESYIQQSMGHSPELNNILKVLKLSEIELSAARDARKDAMDLVMYLGNKTNSGDRDNAPSVDDSELVGGIRLELNHSFDRSGHDAAILQAQLSRNEILSNKKRVMQDVQYEISGLIAQIHSLIASLEAYKKSVNSEHAKLDEADDRYRKGRIDVDRLIQFENQLSAAKLAYALQLIEMQRREFKLSLLSGELWKEIHLPIHDVSISKDQEILF